MGSVSVFCVDSETQKDKRGGASDTPPAASVDVEEDRLSNEDLIAGARRLLGVSPIAATGALEGSPRKTHTLDQAKKLVAQFMRREAS